MPQKIIWSEAQDAKLRRLRAEGETWDSIAAALGLSRYTVIERGRSIGAQRPPPDFKPPPEDPEREPLPAGDPRSWNAMNAGTVLEGSPYPFPYFRR